MARFKKGKYKKENDLWVVNIKNVKSVHYSLHLDEQFTVVFMTVSHSPQMLLRMCS